MQISMEKVVKVEEQDWIHRSKKESATQEDFVDWPKTEQKTMDKHKKNIAQLKDQEWLSDKEAPQRMLRKTKRNTCYQAISLYPHIFIFSYLHVLILSSRRGKTSRGCLDTSANFYVLVTSASEAFSGPETAKRQR